MLCNSGLNFQLNFKDKTMNQTMNQTDTDRAHESATYSPIRTMSDHELQFAIQYIGAGEWTDEQKERAQTELQRREMKRINAKLLAKGKQWTN